MMEASAASFDFTTDAFRPNQRVAAWREIYGKLVDLEFEPTAPDDPFSAEARMRLHESLGIASIRTAQTRFAHPTSLINSDDILLLTLESGIGPERILAARCNLRPARRCSAGRPNRSPAWSAAAPG